MRYIYVILQTAVLVLCTYERQHAQSNNLAFPLLGRRVGLSFKNSVILSTLPLNLESNGQSQRARPHILCQDGALVRCHNSRFGAASSAIVKCNNDSRMIRMTLDTLQVKILCMYTYSINVR